jgi:hypothetical protein
MTSSHPFLTNDICEFNILNNANLIYTDDGMSKEVNTVSSTFFKLDTYHKHFGKYVTGLRKTIKFIKSFNETVEKSERFIYLLFIDQNIRDDEKIYRMIESSNIVVPVLYECSEYMKGKYHADTFGTLLRFFPMFDFSNNPIKMTLIADIELKDKHLKIMRKYMKHKPPGITFKTYVTSKLFYKEAFYGVLAGIILFNDNKLKQSLILDFIQNAHEIEDTGPYEMRKTAFGFGVDEVFLRAYLIPSLEKYNVISDYNMNYFIYYSLDYITKTEKRQEITSEILKLIVEDINANPTDSETILDSIEYEEEKEGEDIAKVDSTHVVDTQDVRSSFEETSNEAILKMVDYIDQNTHKIKQKNEVVNGLAERFYYIIHYLVKHDKSWLRMKIMKLIDEYLRNVISATIYVELDTKTHKITNIMKYDAIYTDNQI